MKLLQLYSASRASGATRLTVALAAWSWLMPLAAGQPTGWQLEAVDVGGDVGQHSSMAMTPAGVPCIAYYDATNGNLKFASRAGGAWTPEVVPAAGIVGQYSSLRIAQDGAIWIAYYNATLARPEVAHKDAGGWHFEFPDIQAAGLSQAGLYTRLALTEDNQPAIVFTDMASYDGLSGRVTGRIWYSERTEQDGWSTPISVSADSTCFDLAFAIAPGGTRSISYATGYDPTVKLGYVERAGTTWLTPVLVDGTFGTSGRFSSIAFNSAGNPCVAYLRDQYTRLKFITRVDGSWPPFDNPALDPLTEICPGNFLGTYTSLAVGPGPSHIVGIATCTNPGVPTGLIYLESNGAWPTSLPTPVDSSYGAGAFTSVGFSSTGDVGISYYNAVTGDLCFAYRVANLDTDNDGLSDADEPVYGTNPNDPDTDDDGLLDGTEVDMAQGTGCPNPIDSDSDNDGLLDGAEVALGTSPCNADTDGDGVNDSQDPTPLVPGVTNSYIEGILRGDASLVLGLSLSHFDAPNNNAAAGRRNAISNKLTSAANKAAIGDRFGAVDDLASLLQKLDGNPSPPDWMVNGPVKDALYSEIQLMIALLLMP